MKNKVYFRTIIIILVLVVVMLSIHFFNLLNIRNLSFTDDWSQDFKLGKTKDRDFKLSSLDEKLLNLNVESKNILKFNIINKDGSIDETGSNEISNFEFEKVNQSYLVKNNYIYLYEKNVYLSKFDSNKFIEPIKIIDDVNYLTVEEQGEDIYITISNDEKISVSKIENEKIENIYEKDNTENIKSAYYTADEKGEYIIAIENQGVESELITFYPLKNNGEKIVLEDVNKYSGYSIKDINIDNLDGKLSISYILRINQKGIRINEIKNIQIDKLTNKIKKNDYDLREYNIENLDSDIETYVEDNNIHILGSGENGNNNFSSEKNDIFDIRLNEDGEIVDNTFISTTDKYSSKIAVSEINNNKYIVFSEIVSNEYDLRIFSDAKDMIDRESVIKEDYMSVLSKVVVIPLISIMYTVIRGLILLFFMVVPLAIFFFTYFNSGDSKDKVKILGMIGIYIITNIIAFRFVYFTKGNEVYYPAFFYSNIYRIIGPIITNILTTIATFVFYREGKIKGSDLSFLAYPVFFVILDVFLNNIFYVPFLTLFRLFGF
ncbi:hypothetical protein [Senegalia sp. (in: firmicutes)]|uniref:hypothetical protein n=1 Tax=Senegalia sp. (in: firmicutes) TaxID=1924098 RepID=UPI003F9A4733